MLADDGGSSDQPLDIVAGNGLRGDPVLERFFAGDGGVSAPQVGGEPGDREAPGFVDSALARLGIDKERLVEALSGVELSGAGDNWRDEQSGEVGLSFDLTDKLSVGPSLGLRWEQEHSGAFREEWSHQLKLGARYSF